MYRLRYLLISSLVLLLSGCAAMTRDECINADWYLIGFEDGSAGRQPQRIAEYRSACAEYTVVPKMEEYLAGHQRGVGGFCTAENGFAQGRAGRRLNPVCHGELKHHFLAGYNKGYELHQQAQQVNRLRRQLTEVNKAQQELQQEKSDAEAELLADGTKSSRRFELYQRIEEIADELERSREKKYHITHELDDEQRYLNSLERESRYL